MEIFLIIVSVIVVVCGLTYYLNTRNKATPLHLIASSDNVKMVRWMLDTGDDPNEQDIKQRTPLFQAIMGGSSAVIFELLKAGADPNIPDWLGRIALHHVVLRLVDTDALAAIIAMLFDFGVDHTRKAKDGKTPVEMAESFGNIKCSLILRQEIEKRNLTET